MGQAAGNLANAHPKFVVTNNNLSRRPGAANNRPPGANASAVNTWRIGKPAPEMEYTLTNPPTLDYPVAPQIIRLPD